MFEWKRRRVLVTGGAGFLGTYLVRLLRERGCQDIRIPRSRSDDLRIRESCERAVHDRDLVFHLAANVGGIGYNLEKPGELFYDNIMMGVQILHAAQAAGVEKVVTVGTICSYPCFAPVPFREEKIWDGYPEETNAAYGLAKKMLLVQSQAYRKQYKFNSIVLFPTNLYGPGDNFDPKSSHAIPAIIKKVSDSLQANQKHIVIWGDGSPTREFLYAEDAAEALIMAAESYDKSEPVNIGSGEEVSIRKLVETICGLMGYRGSVQYDTTRPNGQPRRQVDSSKAFREFGFKAKVPLLTGLKRTIEWHASNSPAGLCQAALRALVLENEVPRPPRKASLGMPLGINKVHLAW